jgi:DivIVA domain-containing protein
MTAEWNPMALTPDEVASVEFPSGLRGWDREDVKAFLVGVAADYQAALDESARLAGVCADLRAQMGRLEEQLAITQTRLRNAQVATATAEEERDQAIAQLADRMPLGDGSTTGPAAIGAARSVSAVDAFAELGDGIAKVLRSAAQAAAALQLTAERRAEQVRTEAAEYADRVRSDADQYAEQRRATELRLHKGST